MAAALSLTFGRGGALVGNLLFGFLIDLNCVVPIVLFAAMLLGNCGVDELHRVALSDRPINKILITGSGLLCLMLPSTGQGALD
jgi:hypothetical protein